MSQLVWYAGFAFVCAIQVQLSAALIAGWFLFQHNEAPLSTAKSLVALTVPTFTALCSVMAWNGLALPNLLFFIFCCGFLALFIFLDAASRCLPQCFTLAFLCAGALFRGVIAPETLLPAAMMAALLFVGLAGARAVCNRRAGGERFGLGDVYLMAGLGMWFSAPQTLWIVVVAALCGTAFLLVRKRRCPSRWRHCETYRTAPFAPFLCGAAALQLPLVIGG